MLRASITGAVATTNRALGGNACHADLAPAGGTDGVGMILLGSYALGTLTAIRPGSPSCRWIPL